MAGNLDDIMGIKLPADLQPGGGTRLKRREPTPNTSGSGSGWSGPPDLLTSYLSGSREHSNVAASWLDAIGTVCTSYTISVWLYDLMRLMTRLDPGRRGQFYSKTVEVLSRFGRAFKIIVFIPLLFALGLFGALLRSIASLSRADMVFEQPASPPDRASPPQPLRDTPTASVSICSYNVIQFPEFLSFIAGMPPSSERVVSLATELLSRNDDIICLQEMWSNQSARYLVARLKPTHPYIIWNVANQILGLNSGLFIASKYPLSNPRFWSYGIWTGGDSWARKGLLGVTVTLTTTQKIFVFVTHTPVFSQRNPPLTAAVTKLQCLVDIRAHTRSYIASEFGPVDYTAIDRFEERITTDRFTDIKQSIDAVDSSHATGSSLNPLMKASPTDRYAKPGQPRLVGSFICGDYNVSPVSPQWRRMHTFVDVECRTFVPRSLYSGGGTRYALESESSIGWDVSSVDSWTVMDQRIDWILVGAAPELPQPVTGQVKIDAMNGASDHLAIRGTYQFT